MSIERRAATGLAFLALGCALTTIAGCAQAPADYAYYAPNIPGAAPPTLSGPQGWQYNPYGGSNYAPNGATGYGPYSQDQMNDVIHDGGNGGGGGRR